MTSWLDAAACRGRPTSWWYPSQGDQFTHHVAVMVCRSCPVRTECLAEAIAVEAVDGVAYGVRGGLDARARLSLARRQRPAVVVAAPKAVPAPAPTGRRTWPRWTVATAL